MTTAPRTGDELAQPRLATALLAVVTTLGSLVLLLANPLISLFVAAGLTAFWGGAAWRTRRTVHLIAAAGNAAILVTSLAVDLFLVRAGYGPISTTVVLN